MAAKKRPTTKIVEKVSPLDSPERKSSFILGLVVVAILALLFLGKGFFVAALVNGHPISRIKIIQDLEKHSGRQALDSLITRQLILDAAKKKNISASDQDVDAELGKIKKSVESQGQKLDQVLQAQGMTMNDLKDQLRISKTMEKLLAGSIKVSDKEIDAFIEQNKDSIPQNASQEAIRTTAKTQLEQQKLGQKAQEYVATLKKNAKVTYFVNY